MNTSTSRPVQYEALAAAYHHALVNVLRGHSAGEDFLELWVPDEDPVKSILNIIEAAQIAGRAAVAVEAAAQTLTKDDCARLQKLAAAYGDAVIAPIPGGYRIDVASLQMSRGAIQTIDDDRPIELKQAPAIAPGDAEPRHRNGKNGDVDVLPVLAAALALEPDARSHEGALRDRAPFVLARGKASLGTLAVLADPATHVIVEARHHGMTTATARAVANLVCRLIEGRTVQDASDHGALLAIHDLYAKAGRPKLRGIPLPSNSGRMFRGIAELLHRLRANFAELTGSSSTANTFDPPVGARWQALSPDERLAESEMALRDFCATHRLANGLVRIDRIEKDLRGNPARVVATVADEIPAADKPILLRALERHLKTLVDDKLQLYLEPLKDRNRIRRL